MKVVFYLNIVSPHQLPLAREVEARVGSDNFIYIYDEDFHAERASMGWSDKVGGMRVEKLNDANRNLLETADLLYTGIRCLDLLQRRASRGLKSYYYSERWFKPLLIEFKVPLFTFTSHLHLSLPGWLRMLIPSYRRMAKGFEHWLNTDLNARYLAIGPWAKKDMLKLGVKPDKIIDWGYFVEPSNSPKIKSTLPLQLPTTTKVLYVGRLLKLKHVDTIIRAVSLLNSQLSTLNPQPHTYTITIVGDGPEKQNLQELANHLPTPTPSTYAFLPSVPITEVRSIMRSHDVLIFASDANDGWGAVVNEALSEGIPVIGTYETGASAALLPDAQLFHCGDYKELAKKLSALQLQLSTTTLPHACTPSGAAERLLS